MCGKQQKAIAMKTHYPDIILILIIVVVITITILLSGLSRDFSKSFTFTANHQ